MFGRAFVLLLVFAGAWAPAPSAACEVADDEVPDRDPYTDLDPERLEAAGYVRFGPFELAKSHTTKDVQALIGADWMLWVETAHFKIGSTLAERPVYRADRKVSKRLDGEFDRLRRKLPRVKKKPKEMDPWLTLHLYAQRLEELYAEIAELFGFEEKPSPEPGDPDAAPFLGSRGKFVVILFEQSANLARYTARYAGEARESSFRYLYSDVGSMLLATSRESAITATDEDTTFYCSVTANTLRNLIDGYGGYKHRLPYWWTEGLAHWYVRRIEPRSFSPTTAKDQKLDYRKDHEWEKNVLARVKARYFKPGSELLVIRDPNEMDYYDHVMAWSRVDYLLSLGNEGVATYMRIMNEIPSKQGIAEKEILAYQERALKEAWNVDPDSLDAQWSKWVLKTYRKRDSSGG